MTDRCVQCKKLIATFCSNCVSEQIGKAREDERKERDSESFFELLKRKSKDRIQNKCCEELQAECIRQHADIVEEKDKRIKELEEFLQELNNRIYNERLCSEDLAKISDDIERILKKGAEKDEKV